MTVACTEAEYMALGQPGAQPPTHGGMPWLFSACRATFDKGSPKKDDAIVVENNDVVLMTGSDPYVGEAILLTQEEYAPSIVDDELTTSKDIPEGKSESKSAMAVRARLT